MLEQNGFPLLSADLMICIHLLFCFIFAASQDYADVSALLYTLRVVLGDGGLPTRPPNSELNDLACPCSDTDDGNISSGGGGGVNAVRGAGTAKGRFTLA
jgi:hypothetical protein